MTNSLIGKEVIVYDRYLFAVPVKGVITDVSDKDGAYAVVFFADNPGAQSVAKHDGKFFHHQQCQLLDEPEKIQPEYEWKLERLSLLKIRPSESNDYTPAEIEILAKEEYELTEWLEDNKPENWVLCNSATVEVGDTILINTDSFRKVEKFCLDGTVLLYNKDENKSFLVSNLNNYYINLADKDWS